MIIESQTITPSEEPSDFVFAAPRRGRPSAMVPPELFSFTTEPVENCGVALRFRGRLDMNTVLAFRDAVFSTIGEKPRWLLLDLTQVSTLEPTGISNLVTAARVAGLTGMEIHFAVPHDLAEMFRETGIDRLLTAPPVTGNQIARRLLAQ